MKELWTLGSKFQAHRGTLHSWILYGDQQTPQGPTTNKTRKQHNGFLRAGWFHSNSCCERRKKKFPSIFHEMQQLRSSAFKWEVNSLWGTELRHTLTLSGDMWGEVQTKHLVWRGKVKRSNTHDSREIKKYITFLQVETTTMCLSAKVRIPLCSKKTKQKQKHGNSLFLPTPQKITRERKPHSQCTNKKQSQNGRLASVICTWTVEALCLGCCGTWGTTDLQHWLKRWSSTVTEKCWRRRSSSWGEGCTFMEK